MDITTIFGSEINVVCQPVQADRQYAGFSGAAGVAAMHLGTRGRQIVIQGRLRATGANYWVARAALATAIGTIEAWQNAGATDFTYGNETYSAVVFDRLQLISRSDKFFHYTAAGYVTTDFIMYARSLV